MLQGLSEHASCLATKEGILSIRVGLVFEQSRVLFVVVRFPRVLLGDIEAHWSASEIHHDNKRMTLCWSTAMGFVCVSPGAVKGSIWHASG